MQENKKTIKLESGDEITYQSFPDKDNEIYILYRYDDNVARTETIIETFDDDQVELIEASQERVRSKTLAAH